MRVQLFCFLLTSIISIFHYFFMVKGLSFSRRHDRPMVSVLCYISRGQGSRPGCVNDCCVFGQLTQMLEGNLVMN